MGQLKPPDVFGELNFLEGKAATASVVAKVDCEVGFFLQKKREKWNENKKFTSDPGGRAIANNKMKRKKKTLLKY